MTVKPCCYLPCLQMGIITTKNKRAEKLTDLSGENSSEQRMVKSVTTRPEVILLISCIIFFIQLFVHQETNSFLLFVCDRLRPLSFSPAGNPKKHSAALKKAVDIACVGEPSLYNCLSLAAQTLRLVLSCLSAGSLCDWFQMSVSWTCLCLKAHAWTYKPGAPDNPQQPHYMWPRQHLRADQGWEAFLVCFWLQTKVTFLTCVFCFFVRPWSLWRLGCR